MLTATYTLVALSVEQTNLRVSLQAVQQLVQKCYARQSSLSAGQADCVCETLRQLYEAGRRRKLDIFVLPALRRAGADAEPLLLELDILSRNAAEALAEACRMSAEGIAGEEAVDAFCTAVERFCAALTLRFEREESELFPIARAAIAGEVWFAVANQMLAHDAWCEERRGRAAPPAARGMGGGHVREGTPVTYAH